MECKHLFKKKTGDIITNFATPLITLVVISVLLISFLSATRENKRMNDLDLIGRKFILHMETDGFLTNENENMIISRLESIGAKNISLSGTTKNSTSYGSEINLMISCDIEVELVKMQGFKVKKEKEIMRYSDSWSSTAKN